MTVEHAAREITVNSSSSLFLCSLIRVSGTVVPQRAALTPVTVGTKNATAPAPVVPSRLI